MERMLIGELKSLSSFGMARRRTLTLAVECNPLSCIATTRLRIFSSIHHSRSVCVWFIIASPEVGFPSYRLCNACESSLTYD